MSSSLPTENRDDLADQLNALVAICKDGEAGFRSAADDVKNLELRPLFLRLSRQRAEFATELQLCVERLGCKPRDSASIAGKIHRGWINLKAALATNDAHAILAECERGEDSAVAAYRDALAAPCVDSLHHALINTQFQAVKAAHDEIRALRDHPTYAKPTA